MFSLINYGVSIRDRWRGKREREKSRDKRRLHFIATSATLVIFITNCRLISQRAMICPIATGHLRYFPSESNRIFISHLWN